MSRTAKLELSVLAAALALGILGDLLFRAAWGLSFAIWGCALAAAVAALGRLRKEVFGGGGLWLLLPMAACSLFFLWRDAWSLEAISLLAWLTSCTLLILRARGGSLRTSTMVDYLASVTAAGLVAAFGMFPMLFGRREWKTVGSGNGRGAGAVLRGTLLSLPPLIVFGMLFAGADGVFKAVLGRLFDFDLTHILTIGTFAFLAGGYLYGLMFGAEWKLADRTQMTPSRSGTVEIGTMLGLIDLLFLIFVFIQIRYLFGGSERVQMTAGLTYSEYARSGFWELLTVAIILLPLLLVLHWFLAPEDEKAQRTFRWLAGFQIALLFIIMASAFERMRLYVREYGLSEQRLYPTAFMGWLAVVFVWFCLTVLRGKRQHFAFGAVVAGFVLVGALQAVNPDALIARTNLNRARAGRKLDPYYLTGLSTDAIPAVVDRWPELTHADQCALRLYLLDSKDLKPFPRDWRSWNISRARARRAVDNHPEIRRLTCQDVKSEE